MADNPEAGYNLATNAGVPPTLKELAGFFLRLGTTAFGGPAAHIAMMEDQLVTRRQWITREEFLDRLAAANLIPGPSSTEVAIYIGYRLAGVRGLIAAGVCFILPAVLMVMAIAWAYTTYGKLPAVAGILYGVTPVLIPILIQAAWRLGKSALKTKALIFIALAALLFSIGGLDPAIVLLGSGLLSLGMTRIQKPGNSTNCFGFCIPAVPLLAGMTIPDSGILASIFGVFLKAGCLVFGSGYVLLNFLRADIVVNRHWLTEPQLLVAVAVGQVTPGPVFTTATFIGYLAGGPVGAIVATVGIFLPAFVLVALTGPLVGRMRRSPTGSSFLDGVSVAAIALIVVITAQLGQAALIDIATGAIALISGVLLFSLRVNSSWLVLAGGVVGVLVRR